MPSIRKQRVTKKELARVKKLLHKKLWAVFSQYIRQRGADFAGYTECYTCRKSVNWKDMNASHRWHGKLDFDEMNIKPCCIKCNKWLHGNLGLYERRLIEEYGMEKVKELEARAAQDTGYTIEQLKEKLTYYQEKLKKL